MIGFIFMLYFINEHSDKWNSWQTSVIILLGLLSLDMPSGISFNRGS